MSEDSGSSSGRGATWAVRLLLAASILANAALAYGYVELRRDIDGADDRIDRARQMPRRALSWQRHRLSPRYQTLTNWRAT